MLIGCFCSVDIFHITKLSQLLFSKTVNMQLITEKTWTPPYAWNTRTLKVIFTGFYSLKSSRLIWLKSCMMFWKLSDVSVITMSLNSTDKPVKSPSWYKYPVYFSRSVFMRNGWQEWGYDSSRFPLLVRAEYCLACLKECSSSAFVPRGSEPLRNGSASVYEESLLIALWPKPRGC